LQPFPMLSQSYFIKRYHNDSEGFKEAGPLVRVIKAFLARRVMPKTAQERRTPKKGEYPLKPQILITSNVLKISLIKMWHA